jgi:ABC-type bacteriocin/lantibiotic exporter with double-glycine peptidase domain
VRLANAGLMLLSQRFVLTAGTAVYGIWLISQSRLSIPQFLVLLQYNNILIQSISNFSIRILEIGNELNVLERSLESLEKLNCGEYQNKRMHVDNGKAVDDLIKLIKKPGRYVMTGQSGVGKTTIIESLYERLISESDRSYIAYVPRESLTLDRDISENLFESGKPEATEKAVFPESSSLLARRNQMARSLSAGEQQRLNIIRLISGTPKIILLDEAVSSVDESGAALFYKSMFAMYPKASILAVSHRHCEVMMFDTQVKLTRNKSTLEIDVVDLQRRSET